MRHQHIPELFSVIVKRQYWILLSPSASIVHGTLVRITACCIYTEDGTAFGLVRLQNHSLLVYTEDDSLELDVEHIRA